jgi:hypothetical protein
MEAISDLHHRAMESADKAVAAKRKGSMRAYFMHMRRAFDSERQAADLAAVDPGLEPTRSVLHRSAAAMAMACGMDREAEQLIARALAGNPPGEIAEELRDLMEQVWFERHLRLDGRVLAPQEIQLALSGRAVGHGYIARHEFADRIAALDNLIYRTLERHRNHPFTEQRSRTRLVEDDFQLCLAAPKAASFAVTLRLGVPVEQQKLDFKDDDDELSTDSVINDVIEGLQKLGAGQADEVRASIPDAAYFLNFVSLARKIAPDGRRIRMVALAVHRDRQEQTVKLTEPITLSGFLPEPGESAEEVEPVTGTLRHASDISASSREIRVLDQSGKAQSFTVPEGMMDDIVRPLWGTLVTVRWRKAGKKRMLVQIAPAEEPPDESSSTR